jgi:hypothetical protein
MQFKNGGHFGSYFQYMYGRQNTYFLIVLAIVYKYLKQQVLISIHYFYTFRI